MPLRQEVYALDGSEHESHPYTASQSNYLIQKLQAQSDNKYAIFFVTESEEITYHYERNSADPHIAHNLNLEIDKWGNIIKSAVVVYPRCITDSSLPTEVQGEQGKIHIIYTETDFTKDVDNGASYRLRLPYETRTYELTGVTPKTSVSEVSNENNTINK